MGCTGPDGRAAHPPDGGLHPWGPNDILARIIAPKLAESLKQTVVVENKPGAAGNLASTEVARAPGDGLTLLLGSAGPNAISPAVYPNFPFDPVKDIAPVSMVAQVPSVLAVRANLEVKSVAEPGEAGARSPAG